MGLILGILIRIVVGWIFIAKLSEWLQLTGTISKIIQLIGVLIIISILFMFF